jgi:hypothetical protein
LIGATGSTSYWYPTSCIISVAVNVLRCSERSKTASPQTDGSLSLSLFRMKIVCHRRCRRRLPSGCSLRPLAETPTRSTSLSRWRLMLGLLGQPLVPCFQRLRRWWCYKTEELLPSSGNGLETAIVQCLLATNRYGDVPRISCIQFNKYLPELATDAPDRNSTLLVNLLALPVEAFGDCGLEQLLSAALYEKERKSPRI